MAFEQNDMNGSMFKSDAGQKRDYNGSCKINGVEMWISAWVKTGQSGIKFFSLSFEPKQQQAPPQQQNQYQQPAQQQQQPQYQQSQQGNQAPQNQGYQQPQGQQQAPQNQQQPHQNQQQQAPPPQDTTNYSLPPEDNIPF